MQTALNPQVVALSKAIMKTESGMNYNIRGASGEWGAAQWMPETWAAQSKAAGVNAAFGAATPEEQDKVIYTQLYSWKNQGYNIGQIASMWNAGTGKPNAYINGNSGVNKYGVRYDTRAYAQKVATTYHSLMGS